MSHQVLKNWAVAAGCALLLSGPGQGAPQETSSTPLTTERHYTLTARVRPLLFWISRAGVGGARIAWEEEADGVRQIELLIGSDPARAPRKINRWGYIRESFSASGLELLGIMTESEEESVDQARARIDEVGGRHAFKAIRGRVRDQRAEATVIHMLLAEDYTYHDLDRLLLRLPDTGRVTPASALPDNVQPGFLFALKSVLHSNVEQVCARGRMGKETQSCLFVFNGALYRLIILKSDFHPSLTVNGRRYDSVIESRLQTRQVTTGSTSSFSIAYGTTGQNREVPIRIVYRPRWWFEAELQLTDEPSVALASREGPSWKSGHR
jgi:hypothetical protein